MDLPRWFFHYVHLLALPLIMFPMELSKISGSKNKGYPFGPENRIRVGFLHGGNVKTPLTTLQSRTVNISTLATGLVQVLLNKKQL